jgi:hypothetical protein
MIDGHLPAYLYESDIDQLALLLSKTNHGISWVTWAPSQQCGNHHVCVCTPTLQVSERAPQTPDVRKLRHLHFEVGKASQVFALLSTLLGN